jgi:hypothetical protein
MQLLSFSFPKSSFPKQNCHNAHNFLVHCKKRKNSGFEGNLGRNSYPLLLPH